MVRYLLCAVLLCAAIAPFAIAADGVLCEERIANLPQDGGKWHVSLFGDRNDPKLAKLEDWFKSHERLSDLRGKVHYHVYYSDMPIFKLRYQKDTPVLPAIKVQEADGAVVYGATRDSIPYSADALYSAIAIAGNEVQGIRAGVPWRLKRPILPWRRKMEDRCKPQPVPVPKVEPPQLDPPPAPIDDGGPPKFEEVEPVPDDSALPAWAIVLMGVGSGLVGVAAGVIGIMREVAAGD